MTLTDIGELAALVLTLFVFTYLLRDFVPQRLADVVTLPYRLAVYLFAGLSAGFIALITFDSALAPWLTDIQQAGNPLILLAQFVPLILALALLLPARVPVMNTIRRLALAFLIGAGAAIAIVGAVSGTLIPLTLEAGRGIGADLIPGAVLLVGVVCTLVYFQYGARRTADGDTRQNVVVRLLRAAGSLFIAVTFGTLYAAAISSTLTVFTERVGFLLTQIFGG